MEEIPGNPKRRQFLTRLLLGFSTVAAGAMAWTFLRSLRPGAGKPDTFSILIDVSAIEPGQMLRATSALVPVCVLRRTGEMLAALKRSENLLDADSALSRQPTGARNEHRSLDPEWFVFVPLCTHLGCEVVIARPGPDDPAQFAPGQGGFFCPCHMARFDLAGRAKANEPSTANLYVPDYRLKPGSIIEVVLPRNPRLLQVGAAKLSAYSSGASTV